MGKLVLNILVDGQLEEVSIRTSSFEEGIHTLRHYGLELITAGELAEAHIHGRETDLKRTDDMLVAEAPIYYQEGSIVWVTGEKNPYLAAGYEPASRKEYVEKDLAAELRRTAKRDPEEAYASGAFLMLPQDRKTILTTRHFGHHPFTRFLFRQHAQAYGDWLHQHGVDHALVWLMPEQYLARETRTFVRTLSIRGLDGMASFIAVDTDIREKTMYGVRRAADARPQQTKL